MKAINKNTIVIVDAYSTSQYLISVLKGYGYDCIHVIPSTQLKKQYVVRYAAQENLFSKTLIFTGSTDELLADLKTSNIQLVIAGSEAGVWLADELNHILQLPFANNIKKTKARRDKYCMQVALQEASIEVIPYLLTSNLTELIAWWKQIEQPIVLKPLASSDAEGVYFCTNEQEISLAFNELLDSTTQYGDKNNAVLAQQKISGDEYVVNAVCVDGYCLTTDIWTNQKKLLEESSIYDCQYLLPTDDTRFNELAKFNQKVLAALDIKNGAAHSEIIVSQNKIYLIEVGARLAGGVNPSLTMQAQGFSQVSALFDAALRPEHFFHQLECKLMQKNQALIVSLISPHEGLIKTEFDTQCFVQLSSFYFMQHDFCIGEYLNKTKSLSTSPGNIYLLANNKTELDNDYKKIRSLENEIYKQML